MEALPPTEAGTLLVAGVQALLAGQRSQARDLLLEYIAQDEQKRRSLAMGEWLHGRVGRYSGSVGKLPRL